MHQKAPSTYIYPTISSTKHIFFTRSIFEGKHDIVTEKDLDHLVQLLDNKESGHTTWQHLMERTTSNMTYKAWRHEPEVCFVNGILER